MTSRRPGLIVLGRTLTSLCFLFSLTLTPGAQAASTATPHRVTAGVVH